MNLGMPQRAALFVLMAENGPVENTRFEKVHRFKLERQPRDALVAAGLITVDSARRPMRLELTPKGWDWAAAELGAPAPRGAGSGGAALYALLGALKRHLDRHELELRDLFATPASDTAAGAPDSIAEPPPPPGGAPADEAAVEARIRSVWQELAREPRDWVELADLRARLGALPRSAVDAAILRMQARREANLTLHEDSGRITAAVRAAALRFGDADMHLLSLEPTP